MGTYNELTAEVLCHRCGQRSLTVVDTYFGYTNRMAELKVGDSYPWSPRKSEKNGGRPPQGDAAGMGYIECPKCGKDSYVLVIVESDIIIRVDPDPSRLGHIPDDHDG